jgi:type III pantothenate kinase
MLAIDVGNTHITAGIFEGGSLKTVLRASTLDCLRDGAFLVHAPEVKAMLPHDTIMVSVRAQATRIIVREWEILCGSPPVIVDVDTSMGIEVRYSTRDTLGVDRLVCAAAAHRLYGRQGRPVIVVDMGTATTIDYVSEHGVFEGGMIAPGIRSAYEGLLTAAPQLPRLDDLGGEGIIGASTDECVRSGVVKGHAAMIRKAAEIMARTRRRRPVVVVTGGLSAMVRDDLPGSYRMDGDLVLKGLFIIGSLQRQERVKYSGSSGR